jgi:hypothetical protein
MGTHAHGPSLTCSLVMYMGGHDTQALTRRSVLLHSHLPRVVGADTGQALDCAVSVATWILQTWRTLSGSSRFAETTVTNLTT